MSTHPVGRSIGAVDQALARLVAGLEEPKPGRGPGRPAILPAAALWGALVVGVLKGDLSQVGVWRRISSPTWWYRGQIQISKEAVYHRLDQADPAAMQHFFAAITAVLVERQGTAPGCDLAPGFTEVVALDASTLDKMPMTLPHVRALPPDDARRLPGKLTAVLDLRRQLFRRIDWHTAARQNDKVGARDAVDDLPAGSLILADMGYFGFRWFDELTETGQFWISKHRGKGTYEVIETLYADGITGDAIVWLGKYRADKAKYPARLIQFAYEGTVYQYLTNVLDPEQLSMAEIATIYARRWDIELAFKLAKTHLHLSVIWSAKPTVIAHQVWAVLLITQLVLMLRTTVAMRARLPDVYMVSTQLLVTYLPQYALHTHDPVGLFIELGETMGFIRPSRRTTIAAPRPPSGAVRRPTIPTGYCRTPRYGDRP